MSEEFFSAEEILNARDLPYQDVEVLEWGGKKVRVLGLNAADASEFSNKMVKLDEKGNPVQVGMSKDMMADFLSRTLADGNNKLIFEPKHIEPLSKKSALVVLRLFEIAMGLSGLGEKSKDAALKN